MRMLFKEISFVLLSIICWQNFLVKAHNEATSSNSNEIQNFVEQEIKINVTELIKSRGFDVEEHEVQTIDGFILTVQRIVNPFIVNRGQTRLKPIILMHGLMGSAADWVVNSDGVGPQKPKTSHSIPKDYSNSLGFTLANNGHDVWLGTMRGSIYGLKNDHYTVEDKEFWDFSFDEHIKFDLPAIIEFVQKATDQNTVGYVGFSHGSLMAFGLLAQKPFYKLSLKPFVALAPLAYIENVRTCFLKNFKTLTARLDMTYRGALWTPEALKLLQLLVCGPQLVFRRFCKKLSYMIFGFNANEVDEKRFNDFISYMSAGTSVKTILHYVQVVRDKQLGYFKHEQAQDNYLRYGSLVNKVYPLDSLRTPHIFLFYSKNDWLSGVKEVNLLKEQIGVPENFHFIPDWGYTDYLFSPNNGQMINRDVLNVLDEYR